MVALNKYIFYPLLLHCLIEPNLKQTKVTYWVREWEQKLLILLSMFSKMLLGQNYEYVIKNHQQQKHSHKYSSYVLSQYF